VTDTAGSSDQSLTNLVIITGMSGAGRSEAIHTFEDLGYFCIDNLPPSLIGSLVELTHLAGSRISDVAVVCDVRGQEFFAELWGELERLESDGVAFRLLFLEAEDDALVIRFKETRRRHPLCESGSVLEGIRLERAMLVNFRGRADYIIDTSDLRPAQLKQRILDEFLGTGVRGTMDVSVSSFGFKYGVPIDADIVMDVRFLPNPYYDAALRSQSGLDEGVREFVLGRPETDLFLDRWFDLLETLAPGYRAEGKNHLSIALGCTGGRHRSVVLAEETARYLRDIGFPVRVSHRDLTRDPVREARAE
jgi:UPF0042 nucleotide-binding protein